MGTNYYVAANHCDKCERYDREYHIGKSSVGWSFAFRGYRAEGLVSWAAWRQFLKDQRIVDEYNRVIEYDEFVDMIETLKAPDYVNPNTGRKNQQPNEAGRSGKYPWFDPEYDWDDLQGYAFSAREFS